MCSSSDQPFVFCNSRIKNGCGVFATSWFLVRTAECEPDGRNLSWTAVLLNFRFSTHQKILERGLSLLLRKKMLLKKSELGYDF